MRFAFIYQPVIDLSSAVAYYRDVLGFEEAWREKDDTVAFTLPGSSADLMLSTDPQPAGPMYLVDDVSGWIRDHPDLNPSIDPYAIPGGTVVGYTGPGGNPFYVFDQPEA